MKASTSAALLAIASLALCSQFTRAQEASSGLDLRATLTAESVASNELTEEPRSGSPVILGGRAMIYPTWKFNDNWFATGTYQFASRPYFYSDLSTEGYGAKGIVLQTTLNYAHVSGKGSILVRAGVMPTAFGSFMLRYDDADNPVIDLPIAYGYYYSPISVLGVAGAEIDVTRKKWDARAQFANSSPANPRSLFAHDQYGNWAGGLGYTIRQGFRVGVSAYHGPYLDRQYQFFLPGEANPSTLPATGLSLEVNWAHGHTSAIGELQRFVMPYTLIPDFRESAGYGEIKQVLSPRWYLATRIGYSTANVTGNLQAIETATGFRINRIALIKVGYQYEHYSLGTEHNDNIAAIQFITTLHKSIGRE